MGDEAGEHRVTTQPAGDLADKARGEVVEQHTEGDEPRVGTRQRQGGRVRRPHVADPGASRLPFEHSRGRTTTIAPEGSDSGRGRLVG